MRIERGKVYIDKKDVIDYISGFRHKLKCFPNNRSEECLYRKGGEHPNFEDCESLKNILLLAPNLEEYIEKDKELVENADETDSLCFCPLVKLNLNRILEEGDFKVIVED